MRVVSLLPSATEIVDLLDAGWLLVGRSHDIDRPEHALSAPVVTCEPTDSPATVPSGRSLVRTPTSASQVIYTLDTRQLIELQPDLIISGAQSSVREDELQRALDQLRLHAGRTPQILRLEPVSLEDIVDDVLRVAAALRLPEAGTRAAMTLRSRLLEAQEWVTPFAGHEKLVGFLEGTDPLVVAGHWTVQIIERAGGFHPWNPSMPKPNAGAAAGPQQAERIAGPSIPCSPELLTASLPEVVIVSPRGADLAQAEYETSRLCEQDWFRSTPAARAGQVYAVDGRQSFQRPGPGIVAAYRWMVGLLQGRAAWLDEIPWIRMAVSGPSE